MDRSNVIPGVTCSVTNPKVSRRQSLVSESVGDLSNVSEVSGGVACIESAVCGLERLVRLGVDPNVAVKFLMSVVSSSVATGSSACSFAGLAVSESVQPLVQYTPSLAPVSSAGGGVVSSDSSVSELVQSSVKSRRQAFLNECNELPSREGFCYLRVVKPDYRLRLSKVLGSNPKFVDLLSSLNSDTYDSSAGSIYGVSVTGASTCHVGVERGIGWFVDVAAATVRFNGLSTSLTWKSDSSAAAMPVGMRVGVIVESDRGCYRCAEHLCQGRVECIFLRREDFLCHMQKLHSDVQVLDIDRCRLNLSSEISFNLADQPGYSYLLLFKPWFWGFAVGFLGRNPEILQLFGTLNSDNYDFEGANHLEFYSANSSGRFVGLRRVAVPDSDVSFMHVAAVTARNLGMRVAVDFGQCVVMHRWPRGLFAMTRVGFDGDYESADSYLARPAYERNGFSYLRLFKPTTWDVMSQHLGFAPDLARVLCTLTSDNYDRKGASGLSMELSELDAWRCHLKPVDDQSLVEDRFCRIAADFAYRFRLKVSVDFGRIYASGSSWFDLPRDTIIG